MAQAVSPLEGQYMNPDNTPELELVKGGKGGDLSALSPEFSVEPYQDFDFNISKVSIVGNEALGNYQTDESRANAVIRAVKETGLPEFGDLNPLTRQRYATRATNYLAETVTLKDGIKARRRDVVNLDEAVAGVMTDMEKLNHPVLQALGYVKENFSDDLSEKEMDRLCLEVLKRTHWKELKDRISQQVAEQR